MCREMMTMNEMKTNDTMKKTKDTTDDARECAPLMPAPPMRKGALASTPRESTSRALATSVCIKDSWERDLLPVLPV